MVSRLDRLGPPMTSVLSGMDDSFTFMSMHKASLSGAPSSRVCLTTVSSPSEVDYRLQQTLLVQVESETVI